MRRGLKLSIATIAVVASMTVGVMNASASTLDAGSQPSDHGGYSALSVEAAPVLSEMAATPADSERGYQELLAALKADGAQIVGDGTVSYHLQGYGDLVLQDVSASDGQVSPQLSGGGGVRNPYISFNSTDQKGLRNGAAAGMTVAICAIPAVGWVACAAAAGLVAVAMSYVKRAGICPNSKKDLRVYVKSRHVGCYR